MRADEGYVLPPIDADEVEHDVFREFADHPEGLIAALGPDGLFAPVPASLGLPASRLIRARSIVQIVALEDRVTAIDAYALAQTAGRAHAVVHLATPAHEQVRLSLYDARAEHGVVLALVVAYVQSAEADRHLAGLAGLGGLAGLAPAPPRVARTRKNGTGTIVAVDLAASRMLGWPAEQLVGKRSADFIHPDDLEQAIDAYVQALASPGQAYRTRLRHSCADGTWKWVEMSNTNLLDDPDAGYVLAEMLDISDEMAALEALRAREHLLRRLAEALPGGVIQVDRDRRVVYENTRIGQVLGVAAGPTIDERLEAVLDADRELLAVALSEVLGQGTDRDLEIAIPLATGLQRHCQIAIRALTADDDSVTGALICATDVTDSTRLRTELERRATTDMPTGCRNRSWVMNKLAELVEACHDLAVIFVDLDDFKSVNDRLGHAAGDEVLVKLAARLRGAIRASDVVGRVGGDEFLVICPDVGGSAGAGRLAERVAYAVDQVDQIRQGLCMPGASVGMAYRGQRAVTADILVAEADAAMYAAKGSRHRDRRHPGL